MNYEEKIQDDLNYIYTTIETNNPLADINLIKKAFNTAYNAHKGVARSSGEPYIFHPIEVVKILVNLKLDDASICAGFLHDVVEDVEGWSIERIEEEFNEEIASLVDGLTKLSNQNFETNDDDIKANFDLNKKRNYFLKNAENMRKIFFAMSQDMRVMVIKLADRLHNMKTLDSLSEERQKRMARETIQIFAPIAHRLGIYKIKSQLEDLSFKYLYPDEYNTLYSCLKNNEETNNIILEDSVDQLRQVLNYNNKSIHNFSIQYRTKGLWSIRNKMIKKKCKFEDIKDILAIRIIVDTIDECYIVLGIVHSLWMAIEGEITDYISKPKPNGYKSLHTKVIINGDPLEIQIRTKEMHETAELGVAAHWRYKEGNIQGDYFERKMSLLRKRLGEWQKGNKTSEEFFNSLVDELFGEQIFCFTPRGDVIDLKAGATIIDFAYRIHSEIANKCVGAKVSGIMVPINHVLKNNEIVEIITRPNATPSRDWLKFVTTNTAKTRIKQYLKKKDADLYESYGRNHVYKIISDYGLNKNEVLTPENLEMFIDKSNIKSEKDLFVNIGFGIIPPQNFVNRILRKMNSNKTTNKTKIISKVIKEAPTLKMSFEGISDILFTRAKCCEPLPGEDVLGYVTIGKGITIHSSQCTNIKHIKDTHPEKLEPYTMPEKSDKYPTKLKAIVNGEIGVINGITTILATEKSQINSINTFVDKNQMLNIDLNIMVKNIEHLENIMKKMNIIPNVIKIYRPISRKQE